MRIKKRGKIFWAIGLLIVALRLVIRLDKYDWKDAPWRQPQISESQLAEELEKLPGLLAKPELEEVQGFLEKLNQWEREKVQEESEGAISQRETGFETPEEAVLGYLAGLRDSDFQGVRDTFLDKGEVKRIYGKYKMLCGIDRIPSDGLGGKVENGSQEAGKFLEQVRQHMEEADFDGLEFMGFVPVTELTGREDVDTESYRQYLETVGESEGGMELDSRAAAVRVNECQYLLFFDLAKKEERWYIYRPGDILTDLLGLDTGRTGELRLDTDGEAAIGPLLRNNGEGLPETGRKDEKGQEGTEREEGFDSPREAVSAYLESLRSHDLEQAVSTFYLQTYLEQYSFDAYVQCQLPRLFGWKDIGLPPANDFAREAMGLDQEAELERGVERQAVMVCLMDRYLKAPEEDLGENGLSWEALGDKLDWGSLEILGSVPEKAFAGSGGMKMSRSSLDAEMEKLYLGADEVESWAMGFEINGNPYILFMDVVEYEGKWYNRAFGNPVSREIGVPEELTGIVPAQMLGGWERFEEFICENPETAIRKG